MPYLWRNLTPAKRGELLVYRRNFNRPWHSPPHLEQEGSLYYHLTAACLNHEPHIGHSPDRMASFSRDLLASLPEPPVAWCVLPNHYHLLARCPDLKSTLQSLGKLHGRTSFLWNGEENTRGRKVWCNSADRSMRGDDHFWATVNYIHHNPVNTATSSNGPIGPFQAPPISSNPSAGTKPSPSGKATPSSTTEKAGTIEPTPFVHHATSFIVPSSFIAPSSFVVTPSGGLQDQRPC